ncbi:hypothetical protein QBC39DRAFT_108775 [Podospora conica]|nr:hypothetical protein QBC39DRAFT_108775 [Schizothecium conicum]
MASPEAEADLSGGPALLSLSLATASIALATTFVRFCVRAGITRRIGADDWAAAVATVVALIGTIFGVIESTTSDPTRALEFDILGQPWYLMSATLSKISLCLVFIALLPAKHPWKLLLGLLLFLLAAVNFAFSLAMNLQCRPLEKLWRPAADGSCWDASVQLNFGYFQGAFSIVSWTLLGAFAFILRPGVVRWPFYVASALALVCAILAIVKTADASSTSRVVVYTRHHFYASLMANLEQNFGLVAANALTLGPLFGGGWGGLFSRRGRKTTVVFDPTSTGGSGRSSRKKAPSRAGSTRPITRASSRASSYREEDAESVKSGRDNGGVLVIDGVRNNFIDDHDVGREEMDRAGRWGWPGSRSGSRSGHRRGEESLDGLDGVDLEAWPRGIIKTVSVEVVEEVNEEYYSNPNNGNGNGAAAAGNNSGGGEAERAQAGSRLGYAVGVPGDRNSGGSATEQDWETMLRNGPPAPAARR